MCQRTSLSVSFAQQTFRRRKKVSHLFSTDCPYPRIIGPEMLVGLLIQSDVKSRTVGYHEIGQESDRGLLEGLVLITDQTSIDRLSLCW